MRARGVMLLPKTHVCGKASPSCSAGFRRLGPPGWDRTGFPKVCSAGAGQVSTGQAPGRLPSVFPKSASFSALGCGDTRGQQNAEATRNGPGRLSHHTAQSHREETEATDPCVCDTVTAVLRVLLYRSVVPGRPLLYGVFVRHWDTMFVVKINIHILKMRKQTCEVGNASKPRGGGRIQGDTRHKENSMAALLFQTLVLRTKVIHNRFGLGAIRRLWWFSTMSIERDCTYLTYLSWGFNDKAG